MTYLSLDVSGAYGWSPRRAAREGHPVAAISSMPFVRCVNARRHQRHKIQSSSQRARFSSRTEWRGALPLLPHRFIHREVPCCVASRVTRWRQHRLDPATEVSRGPQITQKKAETPTEVAFALATPTRVLRDDPRDTSLHVKHASMESWMRHTKSNAHMTPLPFPANAHLVTHKTRTLERSSTQGTVFICSVWIRPTCECLFRCCAANGVHKNWRKMPSHKIVSGSRWSCLVLFDNFGRTRSTNPRSSANKRHVSPRSFFRTDRGVNSKCSPALHGAASAETAYFVHIKVGV